jgi:RimJ/RimL family protein N-acetyltransferase
MKHNLRIEGFAFRLRPVTLEDSVFITDLRNSDDVRLRFVNKISRDPLTQRAWIEEYFERPGDYYWILERKSNGFPEGTISLYNHDSETSQIEWGRWVLKSNSMGAVESAMLIYDIAFSVFNVNKTYCRTILSNEKVVSFHDSCGIARECILKDYFISGIDRFDVVQHSLNRKDYPEIKRRLCKLSEIYAKRIP